MDGTISLELTRTQRLELLRILSDRIYLEEQKQTKQAENIAKYGDEKDALSLHIVEGAKEIISVAQRKEARCRVLYDLVNAAV